MKRKDFLFLLGVLAIFTPFFVSKSLYNFYNHATHAYPLLLSFIKFAILATAGEAVGLRIKTGRYNQKGFGLLPRAIVWGFLGITIKLAFTIFYTGTPQFLEKVLSFNHAFEHLKGALTWQKVLVAFSISTAMNLIYAPVMMTLHKITDTHIINNRGTVKGLFTPIPVVKILKNLNWEVQYNFVFKKTIPFFWIPAHTVTFLLPVQFQVLFAAILGIMLGVILAIAGQKAK